jgi:ketol-acid reductoisomerase
VKMAVLVTVCGLYVNKSQFCAEVEADLTAEQCSACGHLTCDVKGTPDSKASVACLPDSFLWFVEK